jgi:transposase
VPASRIALPGNTRIWIAAGVTDLRRGFTGLSALVQTKLEQKPFSGHVFVFRGRRGDLIKVLWYDGAGLCLFAKRLERGRFVWPQALQRRLQRLQLTCPPSLVPLGPERAIVNGEVTFLLGYFFRGGTRYSARRTRNPPSEVSISMAGHSRV